MLSKIISILPLIFVGITTVTGWWIVSKKDTTFPIRVFALIWTMTFLVELAGHITGQMKIKNHNLYNVFTFFFYITLAFAYHHQLKSKMLHWFIKFFYVSFTVFVIINSVFIQGLTNYQTLSVVIGGAFIFFLAIAYLWQLYVSEESARITHDPFFWFSFGLVAYLGGTTPFLGMLNYLWDNFKEFTRFYFVYVSNAFSVFLNILVTIGFLCRRNYPKLR